MQEGIWMGKIMSNESINEGRGLNYVYSGDLPERNRCSDCDRKLWSSNGKRLGICYYCFLKNRTIKFVNNYLLSIVSQNRGTK